MKADDALFKRVAKDGGTQNREEAIALLEQAKYLGLVENGRNADGEPTSHATPMGHAMWTVLDRMRKFEESKYMLRQVGEMLAGIALDESDRLEEKETTH